MNSKVVLAPLQAPPPEILYFLKEKDPISKVPFVDQIRAYNQAFAFTSIATDLDLSVANEKKGAYCYRIQGDHYHQISSALPEQGEIPKFSQIYFHDSSDIETQIDRRHDIMKQSLNREMIGIIQNVLINLNPFVDNYISAGNEDFQDPLYYILIHNKHGKDMRQYNTPSAKEVAAICFSDETMHVRDILIIRHDNELERISELHGAYDPLAYPMLFLRGEYGWHKGILKRDEIESDNDDDDDDDDDYDEPDSLYWTKQKMKAHAKEIEEKKKEKRALKKKIAQHPEASKISESKAEASGTSNIDFGTLLERESQSQTGLSTILESATIRSTSSMMSLDDENIDAGDKEYLESRSSVKEGKKRAREETEEVQAQAEDNNNNDDLYNPVIKKKLVSKSKKVEFDKDGISESERLSDNDSDSDDDDSDNDNNDDNDDNDNSNKEGLSKIQPKKKKRKTVTIREFA